jgi:hypothetical protein
VIVGAAGAGLATTLGAAIVRAQDATPTAGSGSATPATGTGTQKKPDAAALYQSFLGKLATNLGLSDPKAVDTAIRTSLKSLVDDQLAAGHISGDNATALKQRIDAATVPLGMFGVGGEGYGGGGFRGKGGDHGGNRGGKGYGGNRSIEKNGNKPANDNDQHKAGGATASQPPNT